MKKWLIILLSIFYISILGNDSARNSLLSTKFIDFDLKITNTLIEFNWSIIQNNEIAFFTIESSPEGNYYTTNFHVDLYESSDSLIHFKAVEDDYEIGGFIFYRIKITYKDQTYSYSPVKKIYSYVHNDIVINSIDSSVELRVKNASEVKIVHANGETILNKKMMENSIEKVFNVDLPQGISYINVQNSHNTYTKLIQIGR